jgi:hypothetical protein
VPEFAAFPLGTVLLPGQLLPLQVFEPRYRVMLFDLRDADPAEFVVALIERGSEVGGGDERSAVGCVARILEQQDLPDGRSMIAAVGVRPVSVEAWLDEDPYPRVLAEAVEEVPWPGDPDAPDIDAITTQARDVASLAATLGAAAWPEEMALSEDPVQRVWQLAIVTPLATIDRQRLLAEHDAARRATMLAEYLSEQKDLLTARLEWGDGGSERSG